MEEVTATEAALLTGLSERTIRRRIARGELPARHIAPNRYAIRVRDLPAPRTLSEVDARLEALEQRAHVLEVRVEQLFTLAGALSGAPAHDGSGADGAYRVPSSASETGTDQALAAALRALVAEMLRELRQESPLSPVAVRPLSRMPTASRQRQTRP